MMAARACSTDPVYVLTTGETGTEAALRAAAARSRQPAAVTLLVAHIDGPSGDPTTRWQTLAIAHRARHIIPIPVVLVECEGRDLIEIVERETPNHAVILVGGEPTPWWLPWCSYAEWLAGRLSRTGRTVEFVHAGAKRREPVRYVGGPRVLAGRTTGHPPI